MKFFSSLKDNASCANNGGKFGCKSCILCFLKTFIISLLVSIGVCKFFTAKTVKKAIDDDPKMINDALEKFRVQQEEQRVKIARENAPKIFNEIKNLKNRATLGNKDASKVVVEFFDYMCGHCRRQATEFKKVLEKESNVKVVLMDMPILSLDSFRAAQLGVYISLHNPNKIEEYYETINKKNANQATLTQTLKSLGLPSNYLEKCQKDKEVMGVLEQNYKYFRDLGLQGTPALIVNGELVPGMLSSDEIISILNK